MVPLGVFSPLRKSPPYALSSNLFKPHCPPPPSSSFRRSNKIVKGGTNYTKFPLSSAKEKHVDIYMVMNTTRSKTRTKYSKEVS